MALCKLVTFVSTRSCIEIFYQPIPFGYSDLLRNHNKYAGNTTDGYENPFYTTPQRSPLDNLTFSIGVSYRFNKSGFTEWNNRPPKRDKNKEVFNYKGVTK